MKQVTKNIRSLCLVKPNHVTVNQLCRLTYGWVIIHGDWQMFGLYQPTGGLKGQVCIGYELAATWRWPTLAQRNHSELSHMAGAIDDRTINIVVVIIIIINWPQCWSIHDRHSLQGRDSVCWQGVHRPQTASSGRRTDHAHLHTLAISKTNCYWRRRW